MLPPVAHSKCSCAFACTGNGPSDSCSHSVIAWAGWWRDRGVGRDEAMAHPRVGVVPDLGGLRDLAQRRVLQAALHRLGRLRTTNSPFSFEAQRLKDARWSKTSRLKKNLHRSVSFLPMYAGETHHEPYVHDLLCYCDGAELSRSERTHAGFPCPAAQGAMSQALTALADAPKSMDMDPIPQEDMATLLHDTSCPPNHTLPAGRQWPAFVVSPAPTLPCLA